MNLILIYLIDLSRTRKHSIYSLFLICSCVDLCNSHLPREMDADTPLAY